MVKLELELHHLTGSCTGWWQMAKYVQDEDMKHKLEMGETAMQPVLAQTADLSISWLGFMSSPCKMR